VVYDRPLRHRCGQSQQTFHRIQPSHFDLHPPVGALAFLARRAAPACQLPQPISDLLSPRGHPSFRARRCSGRTTGPELCSLVLGWRCCGTLGSSHCKDCSPPLHLQLARLRHILSDDVQRLCHGLCSPHTFGLYVSVVCCCLTVVSSLRYADAFDNRKLAPACLRQEVDCNS
jgi:hypothetical protein